ncbi:MAG: hypothetical protein HFJ08_03295 [Lachnospiraceae bacterium]|jgi:hypothetical protein|nr:hypothetical protein [Lachnospiraceae bacterium]MCI9398602.1 hypothetical protein [Lachnospiraceae bacterium]MCX4375218.1 hypothetical protein [Lachnospiraceae bacterium]
MARGVKKSLQEKIAQKEELIEALSTRIKKEREELNELLEMQKTEELNELRMAVQKSGMEISEIIQLAQMQTAQ